MRRPRFLAGAVGLVLASIPVPPADQQPSSAPPFAEPRTIVVPTPAAEVVIYAHAPPGLVAELEADPGLLAFSHPDVARSYLSRIAANPQGTVTAAYPRGRRLLLGYVGVQTPDPELRWGMAGVPGLLELASIELSRSWRGLGLSNHLLELTFNDPWFEDKVVISNKFVWHWDLEATNLSKWKYRVVLRRLLHRVGFKEMLTDEPNIRWDPANIFMVRVGPRAPGTLLRRFDELLYLGP
jgi:hypothetical protein